MAGGPSHLETFDYKPKLAEMHGQPMPESFTKGQPIAQLQGAEAQLLRAAARVPEVRQVGAGDLPSSSRTSARIADEHLHHPLDEDRGDQPRPGPHVHEHRHDDLRPARDGVVALLRPGQRERRPAGLRRADLAGQRRPGPADRRAAVAQRLPAEPIPGRPVPPQGRPGALPRAARRASQRDSSATWSTPCSALNRMRGRRSSTIRRSPRASRSTRWRSGCRRACPS